MNENPALEAGKKSSDEYERWIDEEGYQISYY
jgi:hypothetical protein